MLPAKLQHIITAFSMVSDPKLKYQQLLHYGKKLPPFPKEEEVDSNKVRGCVSQVGVSGACLEARLVPHKAD